MLGVAFIDERIAYAEYGIISMKRDQIYNNGQGNITEGL